MANPNIEDLTGTSLPSFQIGIPTISTPVVLTNTTGTLELKNLAGTDIGLVALNIKLSASSNQIVLNSAATETGASWKTTISTAPTGQTADWTLTLPSSPGTTGQVLQTDGTGVTSWVAAGSTAPLDTKVVHTVTFSDTSPYTYLTLPINAVISQIAVIVDTAFNGTGPSISVGITGSTSKFMIAGASDLTTVGRYSTSAVEAVAPSGSTQVVLLTFNVGTGATAGSARVLTTYSVPSVV